MSDGHNHIVQRDGITYYMTDVEFAHADEYIQAIKDEINARTIAWEERKKRLYEKWEKEPFN